MFKKIKDLLVFSSYSEQEEMHSFNVRFLHSTLLVGFFAVSVGFIFLLIFEPQTHTNLILVFFAPVYILIGIGYLLLRRGIVRLTVKLISWGIFVIFLTSSIISSGVASPGFFGLIAIVMFSGMMLGYRYGILFASIGGIAGLVMLILHGWDTPTGKLLIEPAYLYYFMQVSISFVSILIIYMVEQRSRQISQALESRTSELIASQEIYRKFYHNAPQGIMRTTPDGEILDTNQRSAEILAVDSIEALKKRNIKDFYLHANDRTTWRMMIEKTGWVDRFEFRARRADGEIIWIELASRLFRNSHDQSIYYESSLQDITARKKTEERIHFYSQFEKLVTSISTNFISLPTEELERELQFVVEQLGSFLAVDRCQVWLLQDGDMHLLHQWCAKNIEPSPTYFSKLDEKGKNYIIGRLQAGLVVNAHRIDTLSEEAATVKEAYALAGVQSSLGVPFGYHQSTLGWIGLHMVREEREWQDETIRLLKVVGEIVANAMRRRQMEDELQLTQALLEAAIENSPAGIVVADAPDVNIRIANKAALAMRGDTSVPLKDIPFQQHAENWQCYHKDGRLYKNEELPLTRAILNGEITANKELIIRNSDGEDRVLLTQAAPVRDANGKIVAGIVVMPDITERVHITELLQQSEARFRAIVQDQTEMIVRWKPDGTYSFVNQAFCRYLGLSEAEIMRSNVFDHVDYEAQLRMKTSIANATPASPTWGGINHGLLPNGTRRWREWYNRGIFDTNDKLIEIQSAGRDVHDRVLAEEETRQRLEFESLVASISAQMVNIKLDDYKPGLAQALETIGVAMDADRVSLWRFNEEGPLLALIHAWQKEDGSDRHKRAQTIRLKNLPWLYEKISQNNPIQIPSASALPLEAAVVQKNLFDREMLAELMLPVVSGGVTIGAISFQYRKEQQGWSQVVMGLLQILAEVLLNTVERVNAEKALYESEERYRRVLETSPDAIVLTDLDSKIAFCNPQFVEMHGYKSADEIIDMDIEMLVAPENSKQFMDALNQPVKDDNRLLSQEYILLREDGSRFIGEVRVSPVCDAAGETQGSIAIVRDVTERKKAEAALRSSEMRFHAFMNTLPALAFYKDEEGHYLFTNKTYQQEYKFTDSTWKGKTDFELWSDRAERIREIDQKVLTSGKPLVTTSTSTSITRENYWQVFKFPFSDAEGNKFLGAIAIEITEQKRAQELISRQLRNLEALHTIDHAIAANTEMDATVRILLQQAQSQLGVDAADLLLLEEATQMLILADSIGFYGHINAPQVTLRVGTGCAGQAVLKQQNIQITDIREGGGCTQYAPADWEKEGFISYFCVPLIAKGVVKGVLELFHRSKFEPDTEWQNFLDLLAGQAAIAIDNATLFKDLQRSNMEMSLAYDTTLEGWAKALELRDRETEGHSRRVTDLTMQLARLMGMSQDELIHVRRGALLHDIGKMGIPDSILHKPGPLNDEEWEIMKQHPVMAYQLLINIPYLRRSIDIPYGHHERWDGSGYPQGLRGMQIPLAARIFAAIDIWDALLSDRPYRPAWSQEKVLAYLKEQAGVQLDPEVVERFLELLQSGNY